jgi:deoxyribonuclease V
MTLHDRPSPIINHPKGSTTSSDPASAGSFAEAAPNSLDKLDVVLGEWAAARPESEFTPIAVTARISRLAQVLEQRMERVSSRFGLDWGQFLVLAVLRGAGPPFRMLPRELNRLLLLSPAAITNRLYRLEAKGFIERTADLTDRRRLPVKLTARGLSAIDRAMSACVESEHELLTAVDADDLKVTIRTLRRLLAAYEQYPPYRRRSRQVAPNGEALGIASDDPLAQVPDPPAPPTVLPRREMWPTSHRDLERVQRKLARRVDEIEPWQWTSKGKPSLGGVYVSLPTNRYSDQPRDIAWAAAVMMEGHNLVTTATATRKLVRPYRPGYLALTVGPILEDVVQALSLQPDIIIVNAAGRDHIRGAGLAIQLGAALGLPTVGVTERPDIGVATEPGTRRGNWSPVRIENTHVGSLVRTLSRGRAIMAHAGWMTTPETARDIVLRATGRVRVPEPLQRARDLSRKLRSEYHTPGPGLQDGIHG